MGDNIKVVVKVRPLISREIEEKSSYHWRVSNNTLYQIDSNKRDCGTTFTFDKVYDEDAKTSDVYDDIAKPIVEAAIAGINGTIFAYGQTSSGKTYTMSGTDESPGIIQLAVLNLFEIIKNIPDRDFLVRVSFIEIYNETLKDLLDINKKEIKIHEKYEGGVKVDVKEKVTASPEEVLEAMKEGNNNRQTGSTNMNEKSSRSHSIFQIIIESQEHLQCEDQASSVNVSQLNLVDLAGSERAGQTGATGMRFKEGTLINKSLSSLALVIKQLSEDPKKFINYRDSKLTRILQNSLGGNAKTCIICAVTPAALEETISTLQFATRAKTIENKPEVNAVRNDASMIQSLTKELSRLQAQLKGKINVEQHLTKRIQNLQKWILNGFNQRANEEIMGGMRNMQPRRRVTIHSTVAAEEPAPAVNKFCTPMLKYNPLLIGRSTDFMPIQSAKLAPLPEETLSTTPPPTGKSVCITDEIIDLDSDDEIGPNDLSCSPHHRKCRDQIKTPPCRLRKDAEENKKKVKDLEEFTTLEKVYGEDVALAQPSQIDEKQPSTFKCEALVMDTEAKDPMAELKKKLEEKNSLIMNLNDEIETFKKNYQEKNGEINVLKTELNKARDELCSMMKLKEQLETQCEEFKTKLTDAEVCYETLQRKSKSREQELLSLLNEKVKQRVVGDVSKIPIRPTINFLDLSKDISLVNSDNENSINHDDCINASKSAGQTPDTKKELNAKNQIIADLEHDLSFLKCRIDGLEKSNNDLLLMVDEYKNTITTLETENNSLKSNVESLTTDLNSQINIIKTAQNDMESYKSLIQELQIKMTTQEHLLNLQLDDSELENMILHEKKAIANNENIANIIQVFKSNLGKRTKEIEELRASIHHHNETKNKFLSDMKHKTEEIVKLNEEVSQIKDKLIKNEENLKKLISEKDSNEKLLTSKLHDLEQKNNSLEEINGQIDIQLKNLTEECKELKLTLAEKIRDETENLKIKEDLEFKLKNISTKVDELERTLRDKQKIIDELTKSHENNNKYVEQAQTTVNKIKNLFMILTGDVQEIPEFLEDFVCILNTMSESLTTLEDVCSKFVEEKNAAYKTISLLKNESIEIKNSHTKEIKVLNDKIVLLEEKLTVKALEIDKIEEKLVNAEKDKDHLIENLAQNLGVLIDKLDLEFSCEDISGGSHEQDVLLMFEKIVNHIVAHDLSDKSECSEKLQLVENENKELMKKLQIIQKDSDHLRSDLCISKEILDDLNKELSSKASEMVVMEEKAKEWKDQFQDLDKIMKQQMQELVSENEKLKFRLIETKHDTEAQINLLQNETIDEKLTKEVNKFVNTKGTNKVEGVKSPPSLLTICCDTIADTLDLKNNEISVTPTSSNTDVPKVDNPTTCSNCERLMSELQLMSQENTTMLDIIEQFKSFNKELLEEQAEVRKELKLLTEPAEELQKKILNHKTNLSIFTATAYAENVLLKSQVAGLRNKHNRIQTVCQRDIPDFKNQLVELMNLLKEDSSTKNYSDTFDKVPKLNANTTVQMNESTLDDDMLMLDTNVTLTTVDNTVVGFADQTDLDLTQTFINEISCHANNLNETEPNNLYNTLKNLSSLETNNVEPKKYEFTANGEKSIPVMCSSCKNKLEDSTVNKKVELLTEEVILLKTEKENLETKYNKVISDIPKTEELIKKLKQFDEDYNNKVIEITKLDHLLKNNTKEIKVLQEENNSLSTQIMENITEIDELSKELEKLKVQNNALVLKCEVLESNNALKTCSKCTLNDSIVNKEPHTKLSRSLSDSETTSTINKICTLQTELHAGQEDCKVLTEQVAIIKDHINYSAMSMDLDESITDASTADKQPIGSIKINNMPDIKEEKSLDIYKTDKTDCYNFYLEIIGDTTKTLTDDVKIIEIMKLFYNDLMAKHCDALENLMNNLKHYEESQSELQTLIEKLKVELSKSNTEIQKNSDDLNQIKNLYKQVKINLEQANYEIKSNNNGIGFEILKDKVLGLLDPIVGTNIAHVVEDLFNKCQQKCTELQNEINSLSTKVNTANVTLNAVNNQLSDKEKEYNLLKAQNEKIKEISGAVTLDLIRKEENANEHLKLCCKKLLDMKVISHDNINFKKTMTENVDLMVDHIINEFKMHQNPEEIEILKLEINNTRTKMEQKEKLLLELKQQNEALKDVNNNISLELNSRGDKIQSLKTSYEELNEAFNNKIKENTNNLNTIDCLTEQLYNLKETLAKKENEIESLYEKTDKIAELLETVKNLQKEKEQLQIVNQMITKEKDSYVANLQQSCDTIKQNNVDMQKMTSDILVLRESLNEATETIKELKSQALILSKENVDLKQKFDQKSLDCSRLETNIKTHEKTAEIQSRMINKLQKLNEEINEQITERQSRITELSSKNTALNEECEMLKNNLKEAQYEVSQLQTIKESLESRINELEEARPRSRTSMDAMLDSSRRRRQSIQESKRMFDDEHKSLEAVFGSRSSKPEDFFMDSEDNSGRSTPFRHSKGRESLLPQTDRSDRDEDPPSRPSSVMAMAARKRRQSSHDLHRSVRHTPSPHDLSNKIISEIEISKSDTAIKKENSSEITKLREQLASCQEELEDLKEKYRELDDECETCSQYLQERDEQCKRLKREKIALEQIVTELRAKQFSGAFDQIQAKRSFANASVNTDEDWTKLHSLVVDRMSFDAEVEKNKRLTKTIEELRFKKQDLKNTLSKMQKALDKHTSKDTRELEVTKEELKQCKEELKEWKLKFKKLDEECEICSEYLKKSEEQCKKLKEAKNALEAKLQEMQEDAHSLAHSHSVRKKRQTLHDKNRSPVAEQSDAATETTEELSSYQEDSYRSAVDKAQAQEISHLKMTIETMYQQKKALEMQLRSMPMMPNPMYVATGSAIVQNQQITDVLKENQKLRKMNEKLINLCKKRGKSHSHMNRENEDPCEQA